jgi:hypothetical protein
MRKSASLEGWPGLGIPLPDDPTDRPLSASPTAAELARAARGQLTEYASRSAEAAEQVKEELKRRAGSDLPMGYGMNSYSYDDEDDEAGAAWQFSEDTRRLLCVKALLGTEIDG